MVTTVIKMLPGVCSKVKEKQYVKLTTLYLVSSNHHVHNNFDIGLSE